MRTLLKPDGTIPEPESITAAYSRVRRLTVEIARIEQQLDNLFSTESDWIADADRAYRTFKAERTLLRQWIDEEERKLFVDAVKLLRSLQDEEVEFSPEELKLLLRAESAIAAMNDTQPPKGE